MVRWATNLRVGSGQGSCEAQESECGVDDLHDAGKIEVELAVCND